MQKCGFLFVLQRLRFQVNLGFSYLNLHAWIKNLHLSAFLIFFYFKLNTRLMSVSLIFFSFFL